MGEWIRGFRVSVVWAGLSRRCWLGSGSGWGRVAHGVCVSWLGVSW